MKIDLLSSMPIFLSLFLFDCSYDRVKAENMRGENLMILNDVLIRDIENGQERMKIHSRKLEYNRDNSNVLMREGRIDTKVKTGRIEGLLDMTFGEAMYNSTDGSILIDKIGGLFVDRNVKIEADRIWLNVEKGDIRIDRAVRVTGNNFDFSGDGFVGNIREGVYAFDNGIVARIF